MNKSDCFKSSSTETLEFTYVFRNELVDVIYGMSSVERQSDNARVSIYTCLAGYLMTNIQWLPHITQPAAPSIEDCRKHFFALKDAVVKAKGSSNSDTPSVSYVVENVLDTRGPTTEGRASRSKRTEGPRTMDPQEAMRVLGESLQSDPEEGKDGGSSFRLKIIRNEGGKKQDVTISIPCSRVQGEFFRVLLLDRTKVYLHPVSQASSTALQSFVSLAVTASRQPRVDSAIKRLKEKSTEESTRPVTAIDLATNFSNKIGLLIKSLVTSFGNPLQPKSDDLVAYQIDTMQSFARASLFASKSSVGKMVIGEVGSDMVQLVVNRVFGRVKSFVSNNHPLDRLFISKRIIPGSNQSWFPYIYHVPETFSMFVNHKSLSLELNDERVISAWDDKEQKPIDVTTHGQHIGVKGFVFDTFYIPHRRFISSKAVSYLNNPADNGIRVTIQAGVLNIDKFGRGMICFPLAFHRPLSHGIICYSN